jgi:hypothetical protein
MGRLRDDVEVSRTISATLIYGLGPWPKNISFARSINAQ